MPEQNTTIGDATSPTGIFHMGPIPQGLTALELHETIFTLPYPLVDGIESCIEDILKFRQLIANWRA